MTAIDIARFPIVSCRQIGPADKPTLEYWCLAHPSIPYVALVGIFRERGEITISLLNIATSGIGRRTVSAARIVTETLTAAIEFASNLNASHPTEQTSRVGNGTELGGHEMKSADGPYPQPSPAHTSPAPGLSRTEMDGGSEIVQASPDRAFAEVLP